MRTAPPKYPPLRVKRASHTGLFNTNKFINRNIFFFLIILKGVETRSLRNAWHLMVR